MATAEGITISKEVLLGGGVGVVVLLGIAVWIGTLLNERHANGVSRRYFDRQAQDQ